MEIRPGFDYTAGMDSLRRHSLLAILWLGLSSAGALSACKDPRTPEGADYKVDIDFFPPRTPVEGPAAPAAVRPEDVQILDTKTSLPPGVYLGRRFALAQDYPSPDQPHRIVGSLQVSETIKYHLDVFKDPAFVARRNEALKKAAAEHGANMLFQIWEQYPDPGVHKIDYQAIWISSAEPVYPSVEEVVSRLRMQEDGFKELQRFTVKVADIVGRTLEPIQFKGGHEYMLAMVFHPGPVDLGMTDKESLGFFVSVDKDPVYSFGRKSHFSDRIDKLFDPAAISPRVDGVFARGGAGPMTSRGGWLKFELASRSAKVRFEKQDSYSGSKPFAKMGAGEADFIVFERKVSQDELADAACYFCRNVALSCPKRGSLNACEPLRACFKKIEQPSSLCAARYNDI